MELLFKGYLIVDWSANKTPKTGKDSIWWCHLIWDEGSLVISDIQNPATRHEAYEQIRAILIQYRNTNQRVLVGFDFAYGFPQGFAPTIALDKASPWLAVWRYFHDHITDNCRNNNNRFEVAGILNRELGDSKGPFWGCPKNNETDSLSMRKPKVKSEESFSEFRIAEKSNSAHSVWKLCYPGSVGSQVLMGLPYLYALRTDPELDAISRVWPFETRLKPLEGSDLAGVNIVHAEVYPSLVNVTPEAGEIKDKLQVIALAEYFADLDYRGELGNLFAGRRELTEEERYVVETEEGWILGV